MGISRMLSLAVVLAGFVTACLRFKSETLLDYGGIMLALLALIWFPDLINEYSMGAWVDGYTIDNPTPPLMLAGFGWIALVVVNVYLFGWY